MSKRVFQENKTRQIFQKMNISYPLIRTRKPAEGVKLLKFQATSISYFDHGK